MFDSLLAERAAVTVRQIVERLEDVDALDLAYDEPIEAAGALYFGFSGLAVLFSALNDHVRTHRALVRAMVAPMSGTTLFRGLAGVLYAARYAQRTFGGYNQLVSRLHSALHESVLRRADTGGLEFAGGLSGEVIGLGEAPGGIRERFESYLLDDPTAWSFRVDDLDKPVTTLGMAHGLAGVLQAAGSSEVRCSVAALAHAGRYLLRSADANGRWQRSVEVSGPAPQAWCHGTPGVALALFLTGCRIRDRQLIEASVSALRGFVKDRLHVENVGLCHGASGIALILMTVAQALRDRQLAGAARATFEFCIAAFDPSTRFGFQAIDPKGRQDDWGLFNGAAGVAVALLAAAGKLDPAALVFLGIPALSAPVMANVVP